MPFAKSDQDVTYVTRPGNKSGSARRKICSKKHVFLFRSLSVCCNCCELLSDKANNGLSVAFLPLVLLLGGGT